MQFRTFATPAASCALLLLSACAFDQTGLEGASTGAPADAGPGGADGPSYGVDDAAPAAPDAEVASAPDAAVEPPDAAGGPLGDVVCGEASCSWPEICCVSGGGLDGEVTAECTLEDDCEDSDTVGCDGPEDCAGPDEVCCRGSILDASTVCQDASDCFVPVCHTPADCPNDGSQCCEAEPGVGYCSIIGCF